MAFVIDSWTKSYEHGAPFKGCSYEHYKTEMTRAIRRICDKADLHVAYNPHDDDHIVGYACFTEKELHYLYVKKDFRDAVKPEHLLKGITIDSYTFGGRTMQDMLAGYKGSTYDTDPEGHKHWKPPTGWRFTPRITI